MDIFKYAKPAAFAACIAIAALTLLFVLSGSDPSDEPDAARGRRGAIAEHMRQKSGRRRPHGGDATGRGGGKGAKSAKGLASAFESSPDEKYEELSEKEKKVYDAMQEISDENTISYRRVREATEEALTAENPTLRLKALETMMPFADEAVLDVVPLLVDEDSEVREEAANLLEQGLQTMDDEKERVDVVSKVLSADAMRPDTVRMCSSYLEMMDDKIAALDIILPAMERTKDEETIEELKDSYRRITEEDYVDFDQANRWANGYLDELERESEEDRADR